MLREHVKEKKKKTKSKIPKVDTILLTHDQYSPTCIINASINIQMQTTIYLGMDVYNSYTYELVPQNPYMSNFSQDQEQ